MSGYLDQFNQLKPQERRFVVVVGLLVFIVLNYLLVVPHFGELGAAQARMDKAQRDLERDRKEIAKKAFYTEAINHLQQGGGTEVEPEDQAIRFLRNLQDNANENGVVTLSTGRPVIHTNEFFLEQETGLIVQCTEKQMVDFLYSLGTGNSMMRVRQVTLRPDQTHMQLNANLTVVASYQKKQPVRAAAAPAGATASTTDKTRPASPAGTAPGAPGKNAGTNKAGFLTVKRP